MLQKLLKGGDDKPDVKKATANVKAQQLLEESEKKLASIDAKQEQLRLQAETQRGTLLEQFLNGICRC